MQKVQLRRSARGVPYIHVWYDGYKFNVCYFGKTKLYRIFLADDFENKKLLDVPLGEGGSFDLKFVLSGLVEKLKNERPQS